MSDAPQPASELYRQLGDITRRLQQALVRLDALPRLQQSAQALPGTRRRLDAVASRNFQAADTVLTAVEQCKQERERIATLAARLPKLHSDPRALREAAVQIGAASSRIDAYLTEIMLAQAFHDLSGQLLSQVAAAAFELEGGLVQLLQGGALPPPTPADTPAGRAQDQREVDELLTSHGL